MGRALVYRLAPTLEISRSDADSQREEWHGKSLQLLGEILLQLEWEVGGADN